MVGKAWGSSYSAACAVSIILLQRLWMCVVCPALMRRAFSVICEAAWHWKRYANPTDDGIPCRLAPSIASIFRYWYVSSKYPPVTAITIGKIVAFECDRAYSAFWIRLSTALRFNSVVGFRLAAVRKFGSVFTKEISNISRSPSLPMAIMSGRDCYPDFQCDNSTRGDRAARVSCVARILACPSCLMTADL